MGGDFVLRTPNPFLASIISNQIVMCLISHNRVT